jgi:DnaJ-class molecular chaperone
LAIYPPFLRDYNWYRFQGAGHSGDEIKKAFRRLAMRYHPDRNPDNSIEAGEKFKDINEAYEVLGTNEQRQHYDRMISRAGQHRTVIMTSYSSVDDTVFDLNTIREVTCPQ